MIIFVSLKKIISIFLLLQFVTNNSFGEDLFKLPKLFSHFHHHAHEHKDITDFGDFITKHYFDSHQQSEHQGEDKDCDLPFKHCNNCCVGSHGSLIAFIPVFKGVPLLVTTISLNNYSLENEKIKSMCASSVWQPPKLA